jgi:phosphatidylglycerophosphatase A
VGFPRDFGGISLARERQQEYCFDSRPVPPAESARILRVPSRIAIATLQPPENETESKPEQRFARTFAVILASAGGAGYLPFAPGTWGSALAVAIFVLFSPMELWQFGLTLVALFFLGIWAADTAERVFEQKDDRRIVIDEVGGQLVTLAPLLVLGSSRSLAALVTGFVLFRCFDIWKPGPVRWAERRFEGGVGVMMDDLVGGILAAAVLAAAVAMFS